MQMSVSGYTRIIEVLKELAAELCSGRLVFTLEGGYHPPALAASIRATLDVLLGNPGVADSLGQPRGRGKPAGLESVFAAVRRVHRLD